jgi:hypothetical protein
MFARPVVFAAVSLSFLGGWTSEAPRTTRYRVETRGEQVIDLSGIGQGEQRNAFGLLNYLTITLDDTAGGQTVHAVVDSIIKSDTNPLPQQVSLDSVRGRAWHALLATDGKLSNLKRMDSAGGGGQMGDVITNFFPRVKPGSKVGDQWTDTNETTTDTDGQSLTTRTITNYSITGTENRNGTQALKVQTAFSLSQTGEINQGSGVLSVEGTGKGSATLYVTTQGRYLGGTTNTDASLQITSDQLPEPIPVTVTNSVTVTVIP